MELLTKNEKRAARRLGVTAADLHFTGSTCYGAAYGLYNDYYLIEGIFCGYTKPEIYRALLRKLLKRVGFLNNEEVL